MREQPAVTMHLSLEQSWAIRDWIENEHGPDRLDVVDQVYVRQLLVAYAERPPEEILRPGERVWEFEARCNRAIASARELGAFWALQQFGLSIEEMGELVLATDQRARQEPEA
jgi:hypothetical protein